MGLTLFHGEIEQYIPARKGQKHSLRVVREVLTHESKAKNGANGNGTSTNKPKRRTRWLPFGKRRSWWRTGRQSTNIAGAMEFLLSVTHRKTVCFVVSDFFDEDYIRSMQMASRKHDVIAVLVSDPRELELPNVGILNVLDAETGTMIQVDSGSARARRHFQKQTQMRIEEMEQNFRSAKIDFIHVDASGSVVDPLAKFFRMRERRIGR